MEWTITLLRSAALCFLVCSRVSRCVGWVFVPLSLTSCCLATTTQQVKQAAPISYGKDYPLRPELMESAYALYGATNSSFYLDFGASVVDFLQEYCRVPCGFASIADVTTKRKDDRMDSYFLAETLKYVTLQDWFD